MRPVPKKSGPEKIAYEGKIIEVVQQPMQIGEKDTVFEYARRSPGTRLIIPVEGGIMLTREYRPEINDYDFRLPGGKVFDKLTEYKAFLSTNRDISEVARLAAVKEAQEEAGIAIQEMELFGVSRCGATIEWDLYYFVVRSYATSSQKLEDGEDVSIVPVTNEEARDMALNGRMQEDRSALMLLRYLSK